MMKNLSKTVKNENKQTQIYSFKNESRVENNKK